MPPDLAQNGLLTTRGRVIRVLGMLVVLVPLLFGTFVGEDDAFPFGPFKMYAGTAHRDDPVPTMQFEGVTESGVRIDLKSLQFGLRPAEVEGQLERVRNDPSLLVAMVRAYEKRNPKAPKLVVFRVIHGVYRLEEGRPVDYTEETLAEWRRS
jgi:hypothetical protein